MPQLEDSLKWEYARHVSALMDEMSGPFLAGDENHVPDIILAHCGGWARNAGFPLGRAPALRGRLRSSGWRARPAVRRLVEQRLRGRLQRRPCGAACRLRSLSRRPPAAARPPQRPVARQAVSR